MSKRSIYHLSMEQFVSSFAQYGHSKFRATQVWKMLYHHRVACFSELSGIHLDCMRTLEEHYTLATLHEHVVQRSADGTVKYLFKLDNGNVIETVLMRQKYGSTVCVTTQVGCNIGCSFCASGLIKKSYDLTSGEMVEQVLYVQQQLDREGTGERVTNVVIMGIGEPLDNFEQVSQFIRIIKHDKGLAIAAKRITLSTSGLPEQIKQFADSDLNVQLAVSLHAPNNGLRTRIMKINRAYPIEHLMEAIGYYVQRTNRKVMFEYILLRGVNDEVEHALELCQLLQTMPRKAKVNLIPYNPVDEHSQYKRSTPESIRTFYDVLKKNGIDCSVRLEHGVDIDAACGQLRSKHMRFNKEAEVPIEK